MPRCIVPDCASGYDSNKEKVYYFYVPKNEATKKLWQAALERKNFIIKPMQPVCEKHFLPGDILWSRTTYNEEGNILSEVSHVGCKRIIFFVKVISIIISQVITFITSN